MLKSKRGTLVPQNDEMFEKLKKKEFSVSKETSHSVSCITIIGGLNVGLITNYRLIFSHYKTLNDWNRIRSGHFRESTGFQESVILLFFELKLNLCPNLS